MNTQKNSSRLWRALALSFIILSPAISLYAQVNQGELEQNLAPVNFINYEGPHARIETREQIRQIGVGLGQAARGSAGRSGASNRYFVIHSVSAPDGTKLDADIFGLGVDVGVDHIRNLRSIIQGYLSDAYGYNNRDAALLAEYITIYNAVYRGDWNYFTGRYKTPVIQNLTREKTGLSIRFDEWPGRTLILIPLGSGGLSSIDTSAISDSRVVEEMRKEDDKGVQQRKDMVDLKEREAAEAEKKAAAQREAAKKEEQRIAQEQARLDEEKKRIEAERQKQQQQQQQQGGSDSQQQQGGIDPQKQAELDQREKEAAQKQAELDQRTAEAETKRDDAQKLDEFAQQKYDETQQDRQGIAQDQQAAINQNQPSGVIGAMLESAAATVGRLVRLNPATGQVLGRSPLNTVSVRTLVFLSGKILAVAGENVGGGAIRLVEINPGNLAMAKQGEDDIHPNSLLWVNGGDLYAITVNKADGSLNLGRFDANLALQAKSQITLHPNASVTIQQGNLLTQRADGSAALLNPATLKEAGK